MDLHGMKRKELQTLCKKHGIPGTLKNSEMATRLASILLQEAVMEKKITPEDSVEAHGVKGNIVVSGEAVKKVTFSSETEVFEFTRSIKKCQRKSVKKRSRVPLQELRRSRRNVLTDTQEMDVQVEKVPMRSKLFVNDIDVQINTEEKDVQDDHKVEKVPRRSKRFVNIIEVQTYTKEMDDQGGSKVEKVVRRSKRFLKGSDAQANTLERRRSIRLKASAAKPSMGGIE